MAPPAVQVSPAQIVAARSTLTERLESPDPRVVASAKRLLTLLDVATAKTAAERHAAIRRLPVTIETSKVTGGGGATVKRFIIDGKTRLEVSIPGTPAVSGALSDAPNQSDDTLGGPSAANENANLDGRWKVGEGSDCYWDPNDNGVDQCDPDGRWKVGAGSECYFDAADGGPDQCEPPTSPDPICSFEGESGVCATEQEMEDAQILVAASELEHAAMEAQIAEIEAAQAAWCNSNPCEELELSGPSVVTVPCLGEVLDAVTWVYAASMSRIRLARVAWYLLPAGVLSGKVLALTAATALAAVTIYAAVDCAIYQLDLEGELAYDIASEVYIRRGEPLIYRG